jgi:flagellar basal-body rod protein FlgB
MNVIGSQVDLLAKMLDVSDMRHKVLAQNVANVNTPGYRQLDVSFEEAFSHALTSGPQSLALQVKPQLVQGKGGIERMDGNNVDVDGEMGRLAKNTTLYRSYAQIMAVQLAMMRSAIMGQ